MTISPPRFFSVPEHVARNPAARAVSRQRIEAGVQRAAVVANDAGAAALQRAWAKVDRMAQLPTEGST